MRLCLVLLPCFLLFSRISPLPNITSSDRTAIEKTGKNHIALHEHLDQVTYFIDHIILLGDYQTPLRNTLLIAHLIKKGRTAILQEIIMNAIEEASLVLKKKADFISPELLEDLLQQLDWFCYLVTTQNNLIVEPYKRLHVAHNLILIK